MNETLIAFVSYLSPQYEVLILVEILAQTCVRTRRTNKSKHSVKDICMMYLLALITVYAPNKYDDFTKMFF